MQPGCEEMKSSPTEPAAKLVVGPIERFDQKNCMFKRAGWDPPFQRVRASMKALRVFKNRDGNSLEDLAFKEAAWYLDHTCGETGSFTSRIPPGSKLEVRNPAAMSRHVKKAAIFFGASQVGICELDRNWVYSHSYVAGEHTVLELPEEIRYAIVMVFEMDHELVKYSPTFLADAATGKGYSMIPFTANSLARYIHGMGYQAMPSGNDVALSIPLAVDSGLGEMGRNGLLITAEFGPRVIVGKVLTDLPLVPDRQKRLGVLEFCSQCEKCAKHCPSQAILRGGRTSIPRNIGNSGGVLKWPIDGERCYGFWGENEEACLTCIRVCPFNKPRGALHKWGKWIVKRLPWLDPFLLKMDNLLGYGRPGRTKAFWTR